MLQERQISEASSARDVVYPSLNPDHEYATILPEPPVISKDHEHNTTFVATLKQLYTNLQIQLSIAISSEPVFIESNHARFLCVWNGLKDQLDRHNLRQQIGNLLGVPDFRLIQVVGDSNSTFSAEGIQKIKATIHDTLSSHTPDDCPIVLEYGFTACARDTNWIVNEILASSPALRATTVGNIVAMSARAVEEWGAEATSLVRHFVLAYNEDETAFGSDTWLSDDIMVSSCGDKMVCVEGGPQAFVQAVSVCVRGVPVLAVTGSALREWSPGCEPSRFSAAGFLAHLKSVWRGDDPAGREDLEEAALVYLGLVFELDKPDELRKYDIVVGALKVLLRNLNVIRGIEVLNVDRNHGGNDCGSQDNLHDREDGHSLL